MKSKRKVGGEGSVALGTERFVNPEHDPVVRAVVDRIIDRLKPHEVSVPPQWSSRAKPETVFYGRCFERSYHFAAAMPWAFERSDPAADQVWLVHGEFWVCQRHAWVEMPDGIVFDGVSQRFYDRAGYYEAVVARPWYMYSPTAAVVIAPRMPRFPGGTIQLGDWDIPLGLPWADPKNPTRIGIKEAISYLENKGLMRRSPEKGRNRKRARPKN